jgi:hypothetical protein
MANNCGQFDLNFMDKHVWIWLPSTGAVLGRLCAEPAKTGRGKHGAAASASAGRQRV